MRGRKEINWGSPKYYQTAWNDFVTRLGKRRPDYCKKLKGKHQYKLTEERHNKEWGFDWDTYIYNCTGCNKEKYRSKPLRD